MNQQSILKQMMSSNGFDTFILYSKPKARYGGPVIPAIRITGSRDVRRVINVKIEQFDSSVKTVNLILTTMTYDWSKNKYVVKQLNERVRVERLKQFIEHQIQNYTRADGNDVKLISATDLMQGKVNND